jgi:hypothetical protein
VDDCANLLPVIAELAGLLVAHLLLTALPALAAILIAARLGVRSVPVLLAAGLAAGGVVALLAFWAYYGDRTLGETFSYFVLFGAVGSVAWSLYGGGLERELLRQLATPLALWALGSVFLVFLGFAHGGTDSPIATASTRFYGPLPSDNYIPFHFAEWFQANGHSGHPTFAPDWLASDRPPLQTGYVLSQRLFGRGESLIGYQVLGVVLQQLWIVGLWALLLACRVGRLTRALAIVVVLVSDVAIVNGFFVWPKLLPTAMLLCAAALVLSPLWTQLHRSLWAAVLLGALFGLAMMGHGSSIFGIVPLALIAAFRGLPSWRWVGVLVLAGIVVVAPWSAYQRYGEPPGDRLLKYMLAGAVEVDDRGVGEAITDSYGEVGFGGALHNKGQNFVTMAGGGPAFEHAKVAVEALGDGDFDTFLRETRTYLFYNLLPSLGLLLIAPLVMLAGRRRGRLNPAEWQLALGCFAVLALGALFWGLTMFGNEASRTVLHQGSFLLPVLGLCGAVCGLRATYPRFALYYAGFAALAMLALYVPALDPPPGTAYSPAALLLAAAALAGFGALALRGASADEDAASPPAAAP